MDTDRDNGAPRLDVLAERALSRDGVLPAIEYTGNWFTWGQVQHVAQSLRDALLRSESGERQPLSMKVDRPAVQRLFEQRG